MSSALKVAKNGIGRIFGRAVPVLACLGLVAAIGCGESRGLIIQRRNARCDEINARYDRLHAKSSRQWNQLIADVQALLKAQVSVDPKTGSPERRIDQSEGMSDIATSCHDIETMRDNASRTEFPRSAEFNELVQKCWSQWADQYAAQVQDAYPKADRASAWKLMKDNDYKIDLEAVFAASHNASIDALVAARKQQVAALRDRDLARIEKARLRELGSANAEMENEMAEAEQSRRDAVAAVGRFLQGFGQGLQASGSVGESAPTEAPSRWHSPMATQSGLPRQEPERRTCSSDYSCGEMGLVCVKPNYSSEGVCMRSVNNFGVQQYDLPRTNSVLPKFPRRTDCHFDLDCPIGFRCDLSSGACLK
jgi:hypothetical protein